MISNHNTKTITISLVIMILSLAGCTTQQQGTGTLALKITDAAMNVTSLELTISRIDVHMALNYEGELNETTLGEETNDTSSLGWLTVLEGPKVIDLVSVKDVISFLGDAELSIGKYTQIRIIIGSAVAVINGQSYNVTIPSSALKFNHQFTIDENKTTSLLFDFDADRSILMINNKTILKPVAKSFTEFTSAEHSKAETEKQRQAVQAR